MVFPEIRGRGAGPNPEDPAGPRALDLPLRPSILLTLLKKDKPGFPGSSAKKKS